VNKTDLKFVHKLSIGGIEHPLQLKLIHINDFFKKYNRILVENQINKTDTPAIISEKAKKITLKVNNIIAKAVFKSMFKRGFLFWKKPFRSSRHMIRELLKEEYMDFSSFVADNILNEKKEDDKKKAVIK